MELSDFIALGMNRLIEAFEAGLYISGEVLSEAFDELEEYIVDSYYKNFDCAGRWNIDKAYIFQFKENGKYYRIWRAEWV